MTIADRNTYRWYLFFEIQMFSNSLEFVMSITPAVWFRPRCVKDKYICYYRTYQVLYATLALCCDFNGLLLVMRIILFMRPANERHRYNVMSSLIGWAHTQNEHCGQFYLYPRRLSRWYFYACSYAWLGYVEYGRKYSGDSIYHDLL